MASLSARVQFLGKVSQIVIVMEVKKRNQFLRKYQTWHAVQSGAFCPCASSVQVHTWQNCTARTLFPTRLIGGDQHITPMIFGTTKSTAPDTPDLAGRPTWLVKDNSTGYVSRLQLCLFCQLTWKANWPEKSFIPQECIRLSVFLTASALRTRSPVIGQMPPLARVAAMTLPDSQLTSIEQS